MRYVHGHAACVHGGCPLFGVNQAECCSGETAACGPLTAEVAAVRAQAPLGGAPLATTPRSAPHDTAATDDHSNR